MRKMMTWPAIAILIIYVGPGTANAFSIVQPFGFSDKNSDTLIFDGFDSADGALTSARLDFSVGATAVGRCFPSSDPFCAVTLNLSINGDPSPLPVSTAFNIASVALVPPTTSRAFSGNATRNFFLNFVELNDFIDKPAIFIEMVLSFSNIGLVGDRVVSEQQVNGTLTYEFDVTDPNSVPATLRAVISIINSLLLE